MKTRNLAGSTEKLDRFAASPQSGFYSATVILSRVSIILWHLHLKVKTPNSLNLNKNNSEIIISKRVIYLWSKKTSLEVVETITSL